ncbi:MAG: PIN domain-containing protein [Actinobacteria bacterium]|nr:PIN domain-containing protein [Actinomycetota bacterium]
MIALWVDANVILRLLTDDPPEMSAQAAGLAARAEVGEVLLRIAPLVVAETVWVLLSYYGHSRENVAEALIALLRADGVQAEEGRAVVAALESMARSNVDFVDAYLAEVARAKGEAVCSFDQDFARLDVEWVLPN